MPVAAKRERGRTDERCGGTRGQGDKSTREVREVREGSTHIRDREDVAKNDTFFLHQTHILQRERGESGRGQAVMKPKEREG